MTWRKITFIFIENRTDAQAWEGESDDVLYRTTGQYYIRLAN